MPNDWKRVKTETKIRSLMEKPVENNSAVKWG